MGPNLMFSVNLGQNRQHRPGLVDRQHATGLPVRKNGVVHHPGVVIPESIGFQPVIPQLLPAAIDLMLIQTYFVIGRFGFCQSDTLTQ